MYFIFKYYSVFFKICLGCEAYNYHNHFHIQLNNKILLLLCPAPPPPSPPPSLSGIPGKKCGTIIFTAEELSNCRVSISSHTFCYKQSRGHEVKHGSLDSWHTRSVFQFLTLPNEFKWPHRLQDTFVICIKWRESHFILSTQCDEESCSWIIYSVSYFLDMKGK